MDVPIKNISHVMRKVRNRIHFYYNSKTELNQEGGIL